MRASKHAVLGLWPSVISCFFTVAVADFPFVRKRNGKMLYKSIKSARGPDGLLAATKGSVEAMSAPFRVSLFRGFGSGSDELPRRKQRGI